MTDIILVPADIWAKLALHGRDVNYGMLTSGGCVKYGSA